VELKKILSKLLFPFVGIGALLWFLIRVIPKPSRAAYPCMRVACPMASSFVVYLLSLAMSAFAIGKVKEHWKNSRYLAVSGFMIVALITGFFAFQADKPSVYANTFYLDTANVPIGVAGGIFPGRVVWSRDPGATNENCTNDALGKAYYLPANTNMNVVNDMVTNSMLNLTGKASVHEAWDTLFIYFNLKKGKGAVGYQPGEKIFIRTNAVGSTVISSTNHNITDLANYTMARTSPQPVLALLRQLITICGIPQQNISVGDPSRDVQNEFWNVWHTEFPDVNYICNTGGEGRVKSVAGTNNSIFYSDKGAVLRSGSWADMSVGDPITDDKLYTVIEQADYMIYVAALKVHERAGMTLIGKCNFGSHTRVNAMHLHMGLVNPDGFTPEGNTNSRFGFNEYRVLVDLLGHKKLGGNAMLFVVDGLWGGAGANLRPVKFKITPFNNDWPSSIFMSQDPIALESVCYDILKAEFTSDKHAETYPQMEGVDDHLYQAADSSFWPAGLRYDPEKDGTVLGSLGVHEHWDNAIDQKYSRDLGSGSGIELMKLTSSTFVRDDISETQPLSIFLEANYPNPFNPSTTITYHLPQNSHVDLSVYTIHGQCIQRLVDSYQTSGTYSVQWNGKVGGTAAASGVYFARLQTERNQGAQSQVQRMLLLK
jgi:hypothetical protein